jgi:hypothetical protein
MHEQRVSDSKMEGGGFEGIGLLALFTDSIDMPHRPERAQQRTFSSRPVFQRKKQKAN